MVTRFEHQALIDVQSVQGLKFIHPNPFTDDRGSFMRLHCDAEWADLGFKAVQVNLSETKAKYAIRGMHYQEDQAKIVRVLSGSVADVVIDVRQDSPTFRNHASYRLAPGEGLYIPAGCAHGFQVLSDEPAQLLYLLSAPYNPKTERAVRWNDPYFGIDWPYPWPTAMSMRDRQHALWGEGQ